MFDYIYLGWSLFLAVLLGGGALWKFVSFRTFKCHLEKYFSRRLVAVLGVVIIAAETVCAYLLVTYRAGPAALYSAAGLFLLFSAVVAQRVAVGYVGEKCGCGPLSVGRLSWQLVAVNALYATISLSLATVRLMRS